MHKRRAFTLVELMIVIAILAILTGLLLTVLTRSRASADRARCAAQLRGIGQMLQLYFEENRNTLPKLNMMPSLQPPLNGYPTLVQILSPYHHNDTRAFHCPADQITQPASDAPNGFVTYFAREQSSYHWNESVSIYASRVTDLKNSADVRLVQEYEPFHGRAGTSGSMNRLYADLHVDAGIHSEIVIGG